MWDTLVQQTDVTLAVLAPATAAVGAAVALEVEPESQLAGRAAAPPGRDQGTGKALTSKELAKDRVATKGKGKAKKSAQPPPTHTLQPLQDGEVLLGVDALQNKYSFKLRVTVSSESSWVAITGSHNRVGLFFPRIH